MLHTKMEEKRQRGKSKIRGIEQIRKYIEMEGEIGK